MDRIERYAKSLIQDAEAISKEIIEYNVEKLDIELPAEIIDKSIENNRDFIEFLGNTMDLSDEEVASKFLEWHKKYQEQKNYSFNSDELESIVRPYAQTRLQLIKMISKNSIKQGLTTEEVVFVNSRLSYLLDLSITETIIEREHLANEKHKTNQKVITELSSPVVPIQDGMAILPLIGEFDLDRSDHIMNKVIPRISSLNIESIIIDFSGMLTIDAEVASRIFNVHDVLKLLGITTMFTGIRPDLAAKVIAAGIDFSSLQTFANVRQAITSLARQ